MAMDKKIEIQKLKLNTEEWTCFSKKHAKINKSSGREYFNAKTDITENTFNFEIWYTKKLEDLLFNCSQYRIVYKNKKFEIKTVDDYMLKHIKLIIVAECTNI